VDEAVRLIGRSLANVRKLLDAVGQHLHTILGSAIKRQAVDGKAGVIDPSVSQAVVRTIRDEGSAGILEHPALSTQTRPCMQIPQAWYVLGAQRQQLVLSSWHPCCPIFLLAL